MKITSSKNPKIGGLMTKDLLQLRSYKKILITCIITFFIIAILQPMSNREVEVFRILPIAITFAFGMFSIASFNYDEIAKSDKYIRSLPVSIKEIVLSKYNFTIWTTVIGAIFGYLLIIIPTFFGSYIMYLDNILGIFSYGVLGICIMEAIQIPCIYKYGAEKARMQMFMVIVAIIIGLALLMGGIFYWLEKWKLDSGSITPLVPAIFVGLIAIIYRTSYKVAYKIYEKKEF